jgi:RNA polymerase sigma-70 factor (ECF subfamily)
VAKADVLTDRFEASRAHLRAVAYRMLGSYTEADDVVQEAWLRADRADVGGIENISGWLTTIVARICLDKLRARRSRPEAPVGAHLPERTVAVGGGIDSRGRCRRRGLGWIRPTDRARRAVAGRAGRVCTA